MHYFLTTFCSPHKNYYSHSTPTVWIYLWLLKYKKIVLRSGITIPQKNEYSLATCRKNSVLIMFIDWKKTSTTHIYTLLTHKPAPIKSRTNSATPRALFQAENKRGGPPILTFPSLLNQTLPPYFCWELAINLSFYWHMGISWFEYPIIPQVLFENGPFMCESSVWELSMIGTVSRSSNTTKRSIVQSNMHQNVIDNQSPDLTKVVIVLIWELYCLDVGPLVKIYCAKGVSWLAIISRQDFSRSV